MPSKPKQNKQRAHVTRACDNCRKRRAKCNGTSPCSGCAKLGIDCSYSAPKKKRGPKPGSIKSMREDFQAMLAKISSLSEENRILRRNAAVPLAGGTVETAPRQPGSGLRPSLVAVSGTDVRTTPSSAPWIQGSKGVGRFDSHVGTPDAAGADRAGAPSFGAGTPSGSYDHAADRVRAISHYAPTLGPATSDPRASDSSMDVATPRTMPTPQHTPFHHSELPSGGIRRMGPQNLMTVRLPIAALGHALESGLHSTESSRHRGRPNAVDIASRAGEPLGLLASVSGDEYLGNKRRRTQGESQCGAGASSPHMPLRPSSASPSLRLVDVPPDWLLVLLRAYLKHGQGSSIMNPTGAGALARAVRVINQKNAFGPLPFRLTQYLPARSLDGMPYHCAGETAPTKADMGVDLTASAAAVGQTLSRLAPADTIDLPRLGVSMSVPMSRSPTRKRSRTCDGSVEESSSNAADECTTDLIGSDLATSLLRMLEPPGRLPPNENFGIDTTSWHRTSSTDDNVAQLPMSQPVTSSRERDIGANWPSSYDKVAHWLQQYDAASGRIVQRPMKLNAFGPSGELVGAASAVCAAVAVGARICGASALGDAFFLRARAHVSQVIDAPSEFGHIACSLLGMYSCMVMDFARASVFGSLQWQQAAFLGMHPGDGGRGTAALFTRQVCCIDQPTLMPRSLPTYAEVLHRWGREDDGGREEGDHEWEQYKVLLPGENEGMAGAVSNPQLGPTSTRGRSIDDADAQIVDSKRLDINGPRIADEGHSSPTAEAFERQSVASSLPNVPVSINREGNAPGVVYAVQRPNEAMGVSGSVGGSSLAGASWVEGLPPRLSTDASSVRGEEFDLDQKDMEDGGSPSASRSDSNQAFLSQRRRIQRFVPAVALSRGSSGWTTIARLGELWSYVLSKLMHNLGGYLRPDSWQVIYACASEVEVIVRHEGERRLVEMHGESVSFIGLLHGTCCIALARHCLYKKAAIHAVRAAMLAARESSDNTLIQPASGFVYRHVCVFLRECEAHGWTMPTPTLLFVDQNDPSKGYDTTAFPAMEYHSFSSNGTEGAFGDALRWYEIPLWASAVRAARVWPMAARMLSGMVCEYDARGWKLPGFVLHNHDGRSPYCASSAVLAPVRAVMHASDESPASIRSAKLSDLLASADGEQVKSGRSSPTSTASTARISYLVRQAPPLAARVGLRLPWAPETHAFVYPGADLMSKIEAVRRAPGAAAGLKSTPARGGAPAAISKLEVTGDSLHDVFKVAIKTTLETGHNATMHRVSDPDVSAASQLGIVFAPSRLDVVCPGGPAGNTFDKKVQATQAAVLAKFASKWARSSEVLNLGSLSSSSEDTGPIQAADHADKSSSRKAPLAADERASTASVDSVNAKTSTSDGNARGGPDGVVSGSKSIAGSVGQAVLGGRESPRGTAIESQHDSSSLVSKTDQQSQSHPTQIVRLGISTPNGHGPMPPAVLSQTSPRSQILPTIASNQRAITRPAWDRMSIGASHDGGSVSSSWQGIAARSARTTRGGLGRPSSTMSRLEAPASSQYAPLMNSGAAEVMGGGVASSMAGMLRAPSPSNASAVGTEISSVSSMDLLAHAASMTFRPGRQSESGRHRSVRKRR